MLLPIKSIQNTFIQCQWTAPGKKNIRVVQKKDRVTFEPDRQIWSQQETDITDRDSVTYTLHVREVTHWVFITVISEVNNTNENLLLYLPKCETDVLSVQI